MHKLALCSLLLCTMARAATAPPPPVEVAQADVAASPPAPAPTVQAIKPAPSKLKDHFLTYASFGFNAYTYLGATATAGSTQITPASRGIIYQQVGIGYFFHKMLRVQLTFAFGEYVSNLPMGAGTLATFAIIPWLVFSTHGFFAGVGPQLAPISYGKSPNFDAGLYTALGYAVKLPRGFSIPLTVQLVTMLSRRTSFAINPSVALAYRF